MNFIKNLNKDQFIKIIMISLMVLFIALLSSFNTVANMPKMVKVEKYEPTKHQIIINRAWQP
jgi:hypothetical protein